MLKKDSGFCISTVSYSDSSQIVIFYCKLSGKISAIAKGSKRTKSSIGGHINLLSYGELVFSESIGSQLVSIRQFDSKPVFINLNKNLSALNCGLFAAELINLFTEPNTTNEELFDIFYNFLDDIQNAESDNHRLAFLIIFQLYILKVSGSAPVLDQCINCKTKQITDGAFSLKSAGIICRDCQDSFPDRIKLSKDTSQLLCDLKKLNSAQMPQLMLIERVLIDYIKYLLNKEPKMAKSFY